MARFGTCLGHADAQMLLRGRFANTMLSVEELAAGRQIDVAGRAYGLLELLRDGPDAAVWRARSDRGKVALKIYRSEIAVHLLPEFRSLTKLDHESIATPLQVAQIGGLPVLVTAFCSQGTLKDRIRREHRGLPAKDVAQLGYEVAGGLEHAHSQSIVHGDIKPSNIGLDGSAGSLHARILDFGASRSISVHWTKQDHSSTRVQPVAGTPHYCSPEQAAGQQATPPSDVYSLGCVMYEALSGRKPFNASMTSSLLNHHQYSIPPPIFTNRRDNTYSLAMLIGQMLVKDPSHRPGWQAVRDVLAPIARPSPSSDGQPRPKVPLVRTSQPRIWKERFNVESLINGWDFEDDF
jgi:eukaryotic-like serine/threonine-protein kinase